MSSVHTTALSLENRTSEDIEENGIFGISPEEEIGEGGVQAPSFEEIEEEIKDGNRRIFGISPEEEIEEGGIQSGGLLCNPFAVAGVMVADGQKCFASVQSEIHFPFIACIGINPEKICIISRNLCDLCALRLICV